MTLKRAVEYGLIVGGIAGALASEIKAKDSYDSRELIPRVSEVQERQSRLVNKIRSFNYSTDPGFLDENSKLRGELSDSLHDPSLFELRKQYIELSNEVGTSMALIILSLMGVAVGVTSRSSRKKKEREILLKEQLENLRKYGLEVKDEQEPRGTSKLTYFPDRTTQPKEHNKLTNIRRRQHRT